MVITASSHTLAMHMWIGQAILGTVCVHNAVGFPVLFVFASKSRLGPLSQGGVWILSGWG